MKYYFNKENDNGNTEYKKHFINMNTNKIRKYATQLKYRIIEGSGTALYILGVTDEGYAKGINKIEIMYCKNIMNDIVNEIDAYIDTCKVINIHNEKVILIFIIKNNFDLNEIPFLIG